VKSKENVDGSAVREIAFVEFIEGCVGGVDGHGNADRWKKAISPGKIISLARI
jgi:hypothetical protein